MTEKYRLRVSTAEPKHEKRMGPLRSFDLVQETSALGRMMSKACFIVYRLDFSVPRLCSGSLC